MIRQENSKAGKALLANLNTMFTKKYGLYAIIK